MACHGFAGAHLWDHHPIESGLQDFRRPFTLSHSPLPLNYARQRDRTGRLLILILIVILLGLGSWRLRVRLRLRLGRNHSALIQWQWGKGEGSFGNLADRTRYGGQGAPRPPSLSVPSGNTTSLGVAK